MNDGQVWAICGGAKALGARAGEFDVWRSEAGQWTASAMVGDPNADDPWLHGHGATVEEAIDALGAVIRAELEARALNWTDAAERFRASWDEDGDALEPRAVFHDRVRP